jgi:hypothetical protein
MLPLTPPQCNELSELSRFQRDAKRLPSATKHVSRTHQPTKIEFGEGWVEKCNFHLLPIHFSYFDFVELKSALTGFSERTNPYFSGFLVVYLGGRLDMACLCAKFMTFGKSFMFFEAARINYGWKALGLDIPLARADRTHSKPHRSPLDPKVIQNVKHTEVRRARSQER